MSALAFNEPNLVYELDRLPKPSRTAFAAACAFRLRAKLFVLNQTERDSALGILADLWNEIDNEVQPFWPSSVETIVSFRSSPEEHCSPSWRIEFAFADDALATLAYAVRHHINSKSQEAAWAAQSAYTCADQEAIVNLGASTIDESAVLAHPIVQSELMAQQADIQFLKAQSWEGLRAKYLTGC